MLTEPAPLPQVAGMKISDLRKRLKWAQHRSRLSVALVPRVHFHRQIESAVFRSLNSSVAEWQDLLQGTSGSSGGFFTDHRVVVSMNPTYEKDGERSRIREQNLREYIGQWVALKGQEVVAHGTDLSAVVREARSKGHSKPYVFRVESPSGKVARLGL